MKETRRLDINKKIFTKTDILNIGKLFLREYTSTKEAENHSSISFQVNCFDGTSYESESIELFDDGGILDLKRINSLEISFQNYTLDRYMNISLVHGGSFNRHNLLVRGNDQDWVNGIFTRLKEIIDSIKPQDNWIIKHKTLILHIIALGVGTILYSVLWLILYQHIEPIKNPSERVKTIRSFFKTYPFLPYLIMWFGIWLMGIGWAILIRRWLLNLWPDIEFDFGPEHMKVEKLRRLRISIVFSTAIIPIVLAIGYDLLKYFLTK